MFSGEDRGDRPGASSDGFHPPPPASSSLTVSAYLSEATIGFCTLQQSGKDAKASDGSRVRYAGQRTEEHPPSLFLATKRHKAKPHTSVADEAAPFLLL